MAKPSGCPSHIIHVPLESTRAMSLQVEIRALAKILREIDSKELPSDERAPQTRKSPTGALLLLHCTRKAMTGKSAIPCRL